MGSFTKFRTTDVAGKYVFYKISKYLQIEFKIACGVVFVSQNVINANAININYVFFCACSEDNE